MCARISVGAERAVQADRDRLGVPHRIPERLRRLAGQQAAGAVGDGAGDHHRHVDAARLADLDDGVDRGLGVERVEDGFDQQQVGAAVEQALDLLAVGLAQIVERHRAVAGIGDVRRDRGGAVGRPQRAGDEAPAPVLALGLRAPPPCASRAPSRLSSQRDLRHAVVGLRDRGRGERVGRDDVGAGAVIGEMDVADRVRAAEVEQVVVAADLAVPGVEARAAIALLVELHRLDHRAHGAVEHQDALGRRACGAELGRRCGTVCGTHFRLLALPSGRRPSRWQIA